MAYIYLMEQRVTPLTTAPKGTPDSYDRISPNGKPWKSSVLHHIGILRSNSKTQIHIKYKCAGKTLSYDIGAELLTVVRKPQKGSKTFTYRHFLVNIRKDGLASRLSICNNDEVAWIDSTFLPDRNHTEVLRLFEKVKVDGTRINLVLRRVTKFGSKKKWKWFDTSAGLSADNPQKHVSYTGVDQTNKSYNFYKVPGTQLYLDIRKSTITASVLTKTDNARAKIICKIMQSGMDRCGRVKFKAALCKNEKERYIAIDDLNNVILDKTPFWFDVGTIGSKILFKHNDVFLTCNPTTSQIETSIQEFQFEEIPADDVGDCSYQSF